MAFSDKLGALGVPEEWRARHVMRGDEGELTTGPMPPVETDEELLKSFGYDPETIEIVGTVNQWRKQLPNGEWRVSYYFKHRPKTASLDLPALYAASEKKRPAKIAPVSKDRTPVVCVSDVQAGKTAHRGGTPELLERLTEKRQLLDARLKKMRPESLVLIEGGDLFENFESGGNPMFTNDLSLSQQMDLAGTEIFKFVELMAKYGHVDVLCVTSNHTAWRRGKQELGRPQDDLGIFVHKQVEKIAKAAKLDATWHYPADYDESVVLDVRGTVLGLVHGNQYNVGGAPLWWSKQQHGGQPIGAADILLGGHYHHLTVLPTGRNPYTGKSKYFLQMPTLDNGSDWFRLRSGDDSDPGMLVFDITDDGFDLQSLTVL